MKKVYFKTFGCRTNIYDTEVMMHAIKDFTLTSDENEADIIVVNSCTVTNGADSGVRNYINQASKRGVKIIMAGCGVFNKGESLQKNNKVFGVLGHSQKHNINELLKEEKSFFKLGNLTSLDKTIVTKYHGKTKAFLKIQEGCDFRCSYCIIPYVRGNARSQDESLIINQTKSLVHQGYNEFVLTGTNIGSYGKDKKTSLGSLLQKLGAINGVKRVRLGSIEPVQIDSAFKEILDESWLERHLHLALQHTSVEMLNIMRRRNKLWSDLELFSFLAQKGFALGTDFIVGHPGESETLWQDALKNFKNFPITHLHGFIYSKRDGTPSAKMKQDVQGDVSKKRLKCLERIVKANNLNFRKEHKVPLHVLIESKKNDYFFGYDQFYNPLHVKSKKSIEFNWLQIDNYDIKEDTNETTI